MTATTHALIGGAIAATVPNPGLGLTMAVVSHPLLDLIPHWDFGWGWREKPKLRFAIENTLDLSLGVFLSYTLFGRHIPLWYFSAAVFLSEVWDLLEAPYWFWKWQFFPFGTLYSFQSRIQGKAKLPWGVLTQIISVVAIYFVLLGVFKGF